MHFKVTVIFGVELMKKITIFVCIVMLLVLIPINALAAYKFYYPPYLYSLSHSLEVDVVNSPNLKALTNDDITPSSVLNRSTGTFSENATITIHAVEGQALPEYITVEQKQQDGKTWAPIDNIYDSNTGKITCNNIPYLSYSYSRSADLRITADMCGISFSTDYFRYTFGIIAAPGAEITLPTLADRQWYRFGGWMTPDDKPFTATTMPAGGIKLYANWVYDETLGATPPTGDTSVWPFILMFGAGFMAIISSLPKKR